MERNYNLAKHLFNGLTVLDYANDLIPTLALIQSNRSYIKPIQNRIELTAWVIKNQMFITVLKTKLEVAMNILVNIVHLINVEKLSLN